MSHINLIIYQNEHDPSNERRSEDNYHGHFETIENSNVSLWHYIIIHVYYLCSILTKEFACPQK